MLLLVNVVGKSRHLSSSLAGVWPELGSLIRRMECTAETLTARAGDYQSTCTDFDSIIERVPLLFVKSPRYSSVKSARHRL